MKTIIRSNPKTYGVLLSDISGIPFQARPSCADTVEEAHDIALRDMRKTPLSCAKIYLTNPDETTRTVATVNAAGELILEEGRGAANA